jgi:hypothetical protein
MLVVLLVTPASASKPTWLRPECADPSSDKFFFPERSFGEKTPEFNQDYARRWFSDALRRASEPSLSCDPAPPRETYRFLRLRAFDTSMFVRVEARDGGGALWAGIMGRGSQKMFRTVQRYLTREEWTQVTAGINSLGFWKSPALVVDYTKDGGDWVIEGRKGSQYHVVSRGDLRNRPYDEFGFAVLKLAGLDPAAKP